jgi:hypothetical protein
MDDFDSGTDVKEVSDKETSPVEEEGEVSPEVKDLSISNGGIPQSDSLLNTESCSRYVRTCVVVPDELANIFTQAYHDKKAPFIPVYRWCSVEVCVCLEFYSIP